MPCILNSWLGRRLFSWMLLASLVAACTNGAPLVEDPTEAVTVPASPSRVPSPTPPPPTGTPEPSATPLSTPTPSCAGHPGEIEEHVYPSAALPGEIPVRVYLPSCYRETERRYPAIYVLHGKPFDERHWEELGVLDYVTGAGLGAAPPPFLIVMPRVPEPLFSGTDGGPGSYEAEMVEALVPFIDQSYRTESQAERRALAGISRGGVWSLEIGLRNPAVFDRVAALSPALAVNYPRQPYDPFFILESGNAWPSRIYLVAGEDDWALPETQRLSTVMESSGVAHRIETVPGAHIAETWESAIPGVLQYLAEGW